MFLEFKPPLVKEDVVINTELITSIKKSKTRITTNYTDLNYTIQSTVQFKNASSGNDITSVTGIAKEPPAEVDRLHNFYITIFMRDPLFNKSDNNKTFNNAVSLIFSEEDARDDFYNILKSKIEADNLQNV